MGIINLAVTGVLGCLTAIILLVILGVPTAILALSSPSPLMLPVLGLAFLLFIYANMLVRSLIAVFKFSNWNQLFNQALFNQKNQKEK